MFGDWQKAKAPKGFHKRDLCRCRAIGWLDALRLLLFKGSEE